MDKQDNKALGKTALKVSQDTTQVLKAALKASEEGKQVGVATLEELQRQDEQLDELNKVGQQITDDVEEVSNLTKLLDRCWCCFLCCDPPEKRAKRRNAARKAAAAARGNKKPQVNSEATRLLGERPQKYQASTTNYAEQLAGAGLGDTGQKLDSEHRKQEAVVGQLAANLDEMQQIAEAQGKLIESSGQKISVLDDTVANANKVTRSAYEHLTKLQ